MGFWDWLWNRAIANGLASPSLSNASPPSAPPPPAAAPSPVTPPPEGPPSVVGRGARADVGFDIEKAIALMRELPLDDDPGLVLRVVRKTLRSMGVSVEQLVVSARAREETLGDTIANDRDAIERLEGEIVALRGNIDRVLTELEETRNVRESLQDAIASESKVGLLLPPTELARMQAEAATPRPPPAPASSGPSARGSAIASAGARAGARAAPSVPPKSSLPVFPKPASAVPPPLRRPAPPAPRRPLAPAAPTPVRREEPDVPVLSDENDVFSEPTTKQLVGTPDDRGS
jgi:hypothetical protein